MTTETDHGWYRCPDCGNRTDATEPTGGGPVAELPPCPDCASIRGSDDGDPKMPDDPLIRDCPSCDAAAGAPCLTGAGNPTAPHAARTT